MNKIYTKWEDIKPTWSSLEQVWNEVFTDNNECSCYIWDNLHLLWEDLNYSWEDVCLCIEIEKEIQKGGGNYGDYFRGNPWDKFRETLGKEKTDRIIKLYINYKNKEYYKTRTIFTTIDKIDISNVKFYNLRDIKVTATDIEIFMKDVIKESISIKISF